MGENTLALLKYLSSKKSPIAGLTNGYTKPTTVFFAHVGPSFFKYSFTTAKIMYGLLFAFSLLLVRITFVDPAPALKRGHGFWHEQRKGVVAVFAGMAGTMIAPNLIALIMREVLNKGMSWFKNELAPIGLYGPAALLGSFAIPTSFRAMTLKTDCMHSQVAWFLNTSSVKYMNSQCSPLCSLSKP